VSFLIKFLIKFLASSLYTVIAFSPWRTSICMACEFAQACSWRWRDVFCS